MKIELKDFQQAVLSKMYRDAVKARRDVADDELQALVLTAPTGSGKTVMVTALMETIAQGDETTREDPKATFLWVGDQPELNEQSRRKIAETSDVFRSSDLILVDHQTFDRETFAPGKVYFLNTQKLGREKRLVTKGDERSFTIWETIANTAAERPGSFWVILDEAHKGMQESRTERAQAQSIVQKFIKGEPGQIPPIPLLVGLSATPERFITLLGGTPRLLRQTAVDADDVRESGLIKDRVTLFFPVSEGESDFTLLEQAARQWQRFVKEWADYCAAQSTPTPPKPIMVVQVEDAGAGRRSSKTDMAAVIRVVERTVGPMPNEAWAHSFQEETSIEIEGREIRKLRAADIESDPTVRAVFFKTSLTTGWDCPRAEVMMSFRPAADATLIAQLVGRMVRTPLARRIEGSDFLNSVGLYLPHYDRAGLNRVIQQLKAGDPETQIPVEIEEGSNQVELRQRNDASATAVFAALGELPSYAITRSPKVSQVKRLVRFGRRLNFDEIDLAAWTAAKRFVLDALDGQRERLVNMDPSFSTRVAAGTSVKLVAVAVAPGTWLDADDESETIPISEENLEDILDWCGRRLGEGLHQEFWRARRVAGISSEQATLELFYLLRDRVAAKAVEDASQVEFDRLWALHRSVIRALPTSKADAYRAIRGMAIEPATVDRVYPASIIVTRGRRAWPGHIYQDAKGEYEADFNQWEQAVLEAALSENPQGWLRNIDRKDWALCIPYQMGGEYRALYPDFLVVQDDNGGHVTDILEPHDPTRDDAWPKAVGLAQYALRHGHDFRHIEYIVLEDGELRYLDLNHEPTRDEVLKVNSNSHLQAVIRSHGRTRVSR